MLQNLKIRHKITIMSAVGSLVMMLVMSSNYFFKQTNEKLLTEIETGYVAALEISRDLEENLLSLQYAMESAVAAADDDELVIADSIYNEFKTILKKGENNLAFSENTLKSLGSLALNYYTLATTTSRLMIEGEFDASLVVKLEDMKIRYNEIKTLLASETVSNTQKMNEAFESTKRNYEASASLTNYVTLLMIIIFIVLAYYITKSINLPMSKIVAAANDLAKGKIELSLDLQTKDEFGELATAFNSLIEVSKDLTKAANAIGQGNYDYPVQIRSHYDELGISISAMQNNLIEISDENTQQNWLKTGLAELHNQMSGEKSTLKIARNVIQYLAEYLNANVGAIYLQSDKKLKLIGSYALTSRSHSQSEFEIGEGIVGQCALEQKQLVFNGLPAGYFNLRSGTGEATPVTILVTPLVYEAEVIGVVELGRFNNFTDTQLQFMKQVAQNIAISFQTSESRIKLRELLHATQTQAEELTLQQSELKKANEQLEAQTNALKASEKQLQSQQEALQDSNLELEAKTAALELQKEQLGVKNNELRDAQFLIEEKAKDLEIANKYKSEFLANMSHELRTPLNSLLILAKMLSENNSGNLSKDEERFAGIIHSSGMDLLTLINDILDLSKVESGKLELNIEDVYLDDTLDNIDRQFKHVAEEKGIYFKLQKDDELPEKIYSDGHRLMQVVKNLISNAFKFTEKGGVTLSISKFKNQWQLKRKDIDRRKAVVISVRDTGIGIPVEKQKQIFEAFQQADGTTSRRFGGTGLGLSISKELVKILGGEIHLQSVQNEGSTFSFILPYTSNVEVIEDENAEVKEDRRAEAEKTDQLFAKPIDFDEADVEETTLIPDDRESLQEDDIVFMIAENDIDNANFLLNTLRKFGYKGIVFTNGNQAIKSIKSYKYSGIFLSLMLQEINGWKVLDKLKTNINNRHIPVAAMINSGHAELALKMGAISILKTPVDTEELKEVAAKMCVISQKKIKSVLIIEDDNATRESISALIQGEDIVTTATESADEAIGQMKATDFDCIVLDLTLNGMSGVEFLKALDNTPELKRPPIIIHTASNLDASQKAELKKYAEKIIVKDEQSPVRLLNDTALFLHRKAHYLPNEQQKQIVKVSNSLNVLKEKKVLLVDDDLRNTFAISHILESHGMIVNIAKNGEHCLQKLSEDTPDIILMDIMMPVMDGYQAMTEIRKDRAFAKTPIISLTAKAMKGDREKCFEAGANDYLPKPVEMDALTSMMSTWLSQ